MISEMVSVLIGGLLAITGGALQAYLSTKSSARQTRREKREDAYLGYIDALLKLEVDYQYGRIDSEDFSNSFEDVRGRLRLYGSSDIIAKIQQFDAHLYECWERGNIDIGATEKKRLALIADIRKELNIE